nr:Chain C, PROTEIN (PEPTIDE P1027 (FAPGVFPYM)) [synthetic construct]
FAPGVFPYM